MLNGNDFPEIGLNSNFFAKKYDKINEMKKKTKTKRFRKEVLKRSKVCVFVQKID